MATRAEAKPIEDDLAERFAAVRALSRAIAAPLSDADATIQPHPDASPAKWHLAHTTWFFETFVLRDHGGSYRPHDERWSYLFNSYYDGEGERQPRAKRGMLSRPALDEILAYRDHVDAELTSRLDDLPAAARDLIELGLNHEQQHQELMLMDMLAAMSENPLKPAIWAALPETAGFTARPAGRIRGRDGIVEIGHGGSDFAFDCERPRHQTLLHPHELADRVVTNGEWLRFIEDGGYARSDLWLSDGWAWVQANAIRAPLYWQQTAGEWLRFGLDGQRPVSEAEPVCHVSYYEADAFARWAGGRLPTEAEWEAAAAGLDPLTGNQLDAAGPARPVPASEGPSPRQMFGDVWEWTMSAFAPYPGFEPALGTVGEYNGKFMCGQFVLKGASCATPRGHSRASYRNFFPPHARWQFTGVRLARSA
jgi:ergothioneine biosynthesis protein EgtB